MVVGESGLGKSTFVNSLFLTDLYSKDYPGPSGRLKKTIKVESTKVNLKVRLDFTYCDVTLTQRMRLNLYFVPLS